MGIKYFAVALCFLLILGGLYFKFLYDVPDGQEETNKFVSWFLVVIGIVGITVAGMWKSRNPLQGFENENKTNSFEGRYYQRNSNYDESWHKFSERKSDSKKWGI